VGSLLGAMPDGSRGMNSHGMVTSTFTIGTRSRRRRMQPSVPAVTGDPEKRAPARRLCRVSGGSCSHLGRPCALPLV
jgi:Mg-chelatase subunit ChlD